MTYKFQLFTLSAKMNISNSIMNSECMAQARYKKLRNVMIEKVQQSIWWHNAFRMRLASLGQFVEW